jgi:hypothetical protein
MPEFRSLKRILLRSTQGIAKTATTQRVLFAVGRSMLATPVIFYTRVQVYARARMNRAALISGFAGLALLVSLAANLAQPAQAHATASSTVNFQARLQNGSGAVVTDGNYNIEFKLYDVSSGGSALWTEDYLNSNTQGVQVKNGYVAVQLGSLTSFPSTIPWDQSLYITMNIGGSGGSASWDGEMNPRLKLTAVPYAFQAKNATELQITDSGHVATLSLTAPTADRTIILPDASGTVCLESSSTCGFAANSGSANYLQNGTSLQGGTNFNIRSAGTGNATATIQALTGQTADLLRFENVAGNAALSGFNSSGQLYYQSGSFTGTIVQDSLGQGVTYHLPDPGGTSATICLSTGNCTTNMITGAGTAGTFATFSGTGTLTNSNLTESGTNLSYGGNLAVVGDIYAKGLAWTSRTSAEDNTWSSVTYGNGLFVAVSSDGTHRVMTSYDGVVWSPHSAAAANSWSSVTYGNGLFVAVSSDGTNQVMTSSDGINWTSRSAASADAWDAVTYGNGLFVAGGNGSSGVMTSPDGINWTSRTAAGQGWETIAYGNGLFVLGSGLNDYAVSTSPDGITWTHNFNAAALRKITFGNGLFVGVNTTGTQTSPDGITWTSSGSIPSGAWRNVTYGNGLFVAVGLSSGTNRVMTSPDGLVWTARSAAAANNWTSIAYGNGVFAALAVSGSGNRVMTSGHPELSVVAPSNTYQGGLTIYGDTSISGNLTVGGTLSNTGAGSNSEHFGASSTAAGTGSLALGNGATAGNTSSIAIGKGATTTASNQLVIGSSSDAISSVVIGNGVTNSSPNSVTIGATGGSGSNVAGASLNLAGGTGTGTGNGGSINLKVAKPGSTGSGANSLATVMTLSGVDGSAIFQNSADSSNAFQIQNAAGHQLLNIDDSSSSVTNFNFSADGNLGGTIQVGDGILTIQAAENGGIQLQTGSFAIQDPNHSYVYTYVMGYNGDVTYQNSVDSTAAFQIQNANGDSMLNVDTENGRVCINCDDATFGLDVASTTRVNVGSTSAFMVQDGSFDTIFSVDTTNSQVAVQGNFYVSANDNKTDGATAFLQQSGGGDTTLQFSNNSNGNFNVGQDASNSGAFTIASQTHNLGGTPAYVQSAGNGIVSLQDHTIAQAFTTNVTAGDAILAAVTFDVSNGSRTFTCSDNRGNSYVTLDLRVNNSETQAMGVCYALNAKAGSTTVTATFKPSNTTAGARSIAIAEYSGVATASAIDGNLVSGDSPSSGTSSNGATSGSVTTSQDGDLIFGAVTDTESGSTISAGTGFTARSESANEVIIQDKVQTTAGSVASTATFGSNHHYISALVALKSADAAAANSYNNPLFTLSENGQATFRNGIDSTDAFKIQNSAGDNLLNVNSTDGILTVGNFTANVTTGDITVFTEPQGSFNISNGLYGASYQVDTSHNLYVRTEFDQNYISNAGGITLSAADGISIGKVDSETITTVNGSVLVKSVNDSRTALQVQNANGDSLLTADTTNMKLEVNGDFYAKGIRWKAQTSPSSGYSWWSIAYGNGRFVTVADNGSERIMSSPDGVNWTQYADPTSAGSGWRSVTYGNGLFVAVANSGTDRVMTSPDGLNWTVHMAAAANNWTSITYGNGLFVAVANDGVSDSVMTSPDGANWTSQTAESNFWYSVTYGNGLFVAVAISGDGDRVMTSPDGINWTSRNSAADHDWRSVTYGNGLFVAVSDNGSSDGVMTSSDGIHWDSRVEANDTSWLSVAYANGMFVAAGWSASSNAVMTSGQLDLTVASNNNTYQGGVMVYGSSTFRSDDNSTSAFQVQDAGGTAAILLSTNNVTGGANAADAILKIAKDSGTNRSINAAGSINASGADYAEWIPWSGDKPGPGSIVDYNGVSFVVSSAITAAFIGNDNFEDGSGLLVTFTGQVPVKVTGAVHAGDLLLPNGDGTAKAVASDLATLQQQISKLGITTETNTSGDVKLVKAVITAPASTPISTGLQGGDNLIQTVTALNVTGLLAVGELKVNGAATFGGTIFIGDETGNVSTTPLHQLRFAGTARNQVSLTLVPDYPGATVNSDGSNNHGSLTSGYCSNQPPVNTDVCAHANEAQNYYSWTTTEPTTQDQDIWVRWQVPSNFDTTDNLPTINFNSWLTDKARDAITLTIRNGNTICGTATPAAGNNGTWNLTTYNGGACNAQPGTVLTFDIHLSAATNDFARVGEIRIDYNAVF